MRNSFIGLLDFKGLNSNLRGPGDIELRPLPALSEYKLDTHSYFSFTLIGVLFFNSCLGEPTFTCPSSEGFFPIPNTCGSDYYVCVSGSPYVSVSLLCKITS